MGGVAITGSQAGFGLAIRKHLEASDRPVVGIDRPGRGAEIEADLSLPDGRRHAIAGVLDHCGGILDGLVCNTAVDHAPDHLAVSLNYFGAVDLLAGLREALARGSQPAAVVHVPNSALITPGIPEDVVETLLRGEPGRALDLLKDHPGKAGASTSLALARWVRRQAPTMGWAGCGITLNGVSTGPVMTDPLSQALINPIAEWWSWYSSLWAPYLMKPWFENPVAGKAVRELPCPLGRTPTPEQVASVCDFLLGAGARCLVGQIIAIDGGIEATFRHDDWPSALPPARS